MRKEIIEFERKTDMNDNTTEYTITLFACQLSRDEQKSIRDELEKYSVEYEYIDFDSLRAIIHRADYNLLEELEDSGWSF